MNEHPEHNKHLPILFDEPFVEAKAASTAAMMSPKLPMMMRKAGRVAGVYALSYLAVKGLDKAAETHPNNKFINGVDEIANVVFGFENLAVGGTLLIAEAGYDALKAPSAPKQPSLQPLQPQLLKEPEPTQSIHPKHRHHRSRAPLNAKLSPDVREPAPPLFGDVDVQFSQTVPTGKQKLSEAHHALQPTPELRP